MADPLSGLSETIKEVYRLSTDLQNLLDEVSPSVSGLNAISSLKRQVEDAVEGQSPLKLLLFGGTGVGKSSILNALAQQELSSVSHLKRAHTSGFTLYLHSSWRNQSRGVDQSKVPSVGWWWPNELNECSQFVYHDITALESICLIDAPDLDSMIEMHRERALRALESIDVPLWVSTPQKYRDHNCLEALKLLDHRRAVIALLNQVDLIDPNDWEELLHDAQSSSVELGLKEISWHLTSCVTPREGEGEDLGETSSDFMAMSDLRLYLTERFNLSERARVRGLGIGVMLFEVVELLRAPVVRLESRAQLYEWSGAAKAALSPRMVDYAHALLRHSLCQLDLIDRGDRQSSDDETMRQSPLDSKRTVELLLAGLWWLVEGVFDAEAKRRALSHEHESASALRSAELSLMIELSRFDFLSSEEDSEHRSERDEPNLLSRVSAMTRLMSAELIKSRALNVKRSMKRLLGISSVALILSTLFAYFIHGEAGSIASLVSLSVPLTLFITLSFGRLTCEKLLLERERELTLMTDQLIQSEALNEAFTLWLESLIGTQVVKLDPRQKLTLKRYQAHLETLLKTGQSLVGEEHSS